MPIIMSTKHPPQKGRSKTLDPDDLFAIFDSAPTEHMGAPPQDTLVSPQNPKGHAHRKTRSLVGFDPMLETMEQSKSAHGRGSSKVWTGNEILNDSDHPLLSSTSDKTTKKIPSSHRSSKSVCISDLHNIASELSLQRPRAITSEEERRITLGDSTKDSISKHDRKLLKKSHRKSHSVSEIIGLIPKSTHPVTPVMNGRALVKSKSPANTPPRSTDNTPIQSPILFRSSKLSPPQFQMTPLTPPNIPTLAKQSPTSFLKDAATMAPRSSEQDPSPHQLAIPTPKELFVHAKLCALLESYLSMDQNFDFNVLKGIDSLTLKGFVSLDTNVPGLAKDQKPVVQALLDCADDVSVEGYFVSGETDEERLEVGVFSIQNTFLVVYRGTTEQQLKPGRAKSAGVELDQENPVLVYSPFRDAYFELETQVYALLDTLVDKNPFSDVFFIGYSFGGALATIGAVRFAIARPMLRFACYTFGSPKVGASDFRQMVNTLPNLKVMRVEYGSDPNTTYPADVGTTKFQHVGQSIVINASVGTSNSKHPSHPVLAYRFEHKKPTSSMTNLLQIRKHDIQAYVRALEPFALEKLEWVSSYVGEDIGKGICGENNEKRLVV